MDGKHIVVVEDIDIQREATAEYLRRSGYEVSEASTGAALRDLSRSRRIDLAVLDLHLPDEDGFALVRFLRENQNCGIILMTANDDPTDKVVGLEVGADDYVTKPHPTRELLARIRSVLRRVPAATGSEQAPAAPAPSTASAGDWHLDASARCLRGPGGRQVDLTAAEYALMRELVRRPGEVLDRDQLMRAVFQRAWSYEDRSMDVLVTRLRRKLEPIGQAHRIRSVRGSGYMIEAPD